MNSLAFLTCCLVFTYSCLSQEGFSGGWTVSLRVDEFSCIFEIMIIACPCIQYYFLLFLDSSRLQEFLCCLSLAGALSHHFFLLALYCWVPVEHSDPYLHLVLSFSFLFFLCIELLLCPPPLLCEHGRVSSAQDSADCLISASSHLPPAFPEDLPHLSPSHCLGTLPSISNFMPWPHIKISVKKHPVHAQGWHGTRHFRWASGYFML